MADNQCRVQRGRVAVAFPIQVNHTLAFVLILAFNAPQFQLVAVHFDGAFGAVNLYVGAEARIRAGRAHKGCRSAVFEFHKRCGHILRFDHMIKHTHI